ncbi:3-phosphoshikimate 1-carboxyvinyltransferase [Xenorhabdus sp. 12]|uniref:3-phosphoshikimate 1-carboxyvinyltransferase n=1 Tax=Xenorhabdus santafensis TaxID=2582833 RepID=A0ABU4S7J9_9GAMM|nr:3-phosphoshikimate 1-carboxyvinyltransferase [Xenorhabdus sp. 12]MDX7986181.1 3-phosphoshikimate 1-carboxyvinyltransferase [Xenorhabdus sp. 12]
MDKVSILPGSILNGSIVIPSSKPHMQRALLLSLLNENKTRITNISWCTETEDLLTALQKFGLDILKRTNKEILLKGVKPPFFCKGVIDSNGSGMLFRTILALASLSENDVYIKCNKSLFGRDSILDLGYLSHLNLKVEKEDSNIFHVSKMLHSHIVPICTAKSTQFLTFSLMVKPLSKNKEILIDKKGIDTDGKYGYLKITIEMMSLLGCNVIELDSCYLVTSYDSKDIELVMPSDFTAFSYIASSVISIGEPCVVRICNFISGNTLNEEKLFNIYKKLGLIIEVDLKKNEMEISISNRQVNLNEEFDLRELPSVATNIIAAAINNHGNVTFNGLSAINNHKCQRAFVISENIRSMGGECQLIFNEVGAFTKLKITGKGPINGGGHISSYNDHRICASNIIASLGAKKTTVIDSVDKLNDGFPNFIECLSKLGAKIN